MELFGKEIRCRSTSCAYNDNISSIINASEYINLFIQVTNGCQANCPFCIYHNKSIDDFDIVKFREVLEEISDHAVKKLNITGGEPCLYTDLFDKVMESISNHFSNRGSEITLNTNGINLEHAFEYSKNINYYAISRHHYDDNKNYKIFETDRIPSMHEIISCINKYNILKDSDIQLRCNLIDGYIDSLDQIKIYMKMWMDAGINDFGFVTLMLNNDFCKSHQIDFNDLIKEDKDIITNYTHTRYENSEIYCKCANYVYKNNGKLATFYTRLFNHNENTDSILVYDGKYLRHGFGGEIIY